MPSDGGSAAQEAQRLRHRAGRHWTQSAHAVPCPESSRGELPRGHDWVSGDEAAGGTDSTSTLPNPRANCRPSDEPNTQTAPALQGLLADAQSADGSHLHWPSQLPTRPESARHSHADCVLSVLCGHTNQAGHRLAQLHVHSAGIGNVEGRAESSNTIG